MQFRRSAPLLGLILSLVISVVPAPAQKLGQKVSKSTKTATEKSADKSGVMRQTRGFAPSGAICASNAPISPGQTINGALATSDCQLSDGSYFDEYTFTANAGQQVWISMSSASFNTYLVLVNPDNTNVQDDDGGGGTNSRIPAGNNFIALPQTGTYSILANSSGSGAVTGPYSVTLTFDSGGGTVCPPTPTPIANGQTLNGTLSATDCVLQDNTAYDSFSFTANAGQQVAITMTSTSQVDPYLFLVAPDGSTIGEDDNGGGGTSARIPPIAGTFGSLPATGTYIIFANTLQPTQFGNYSVTLNFSGSSCAAAPISIGQTISGALAATDCRLPGDGSFFDSYTFNGTAGQQIAIAMTSTSFDDFLILLSPTGSVIATDDNSGGGTNARIAGASGTLPSTGTYTILANSSLPNQTGPYALTLSLASTAATVQLTFPSYAAGEGAGTVNISVTRTGDLTLPASVDYKTTDSAGLNNCSVVNHVASARCDYATSVGTARFAVGQSTKTISIPLVDDSYAEGDESFTITLSNAVGATLGGLSTAPVTIQDNEGLTNGANPIDQTPFFVRQHYIDFLGREPDPGGYAGWQAIINNCAPGDTNCDRIHVSSAFFRSPEFQERGYFVYRFYSVSFGRKSDYAEFIPDIAKVSGFLTDAELEAAKVAFINEFMTRPAFVTKFVTPGLSATQYVDLLLSTAGVTVSQATHDNWVALAATSRPQVLRQISESTEVYNKYYNQAFVVMQYFGYLRRDPDGQYLDWIQQLDSSGDFRAMVNGFMNSTEYRIRFGP